MSMLNEETGRLEIFENFVKDIKPKDNSVTGFNTGSVILTADNTVGWNNGITKKKKIKKPGFLFSMFKDSFIDRIFKTTKNHYTKIHEKNCQSQRIYIENLLINAKNSGQTAFIEKLEDEKKRIDLEMKLYKMGIQTFLEEEDLVKLAKTKVGGTKIDDIISITWLKNFGRKIPNEVYELIPKIREAEVFENFVIMHYNDGRQKELETKAEERKRKDPILFGVTECSNRLYFIADWMDEYCELTLKDVLRTLQVDEADRMLYAENIVKLTNKAEQKEDPEETQ